MNSEIPCGQIAWNDLTVPDAESIRDFYESVVGWKSSPVSMGDYSDYSMEDGDGNVVAGVCHAKVENARIYPYWLVYVTVPDLDASVEQCESSGGTVVDGPRTTGDARIAIIKDPAGAVLSLYQPVIPEAKPSAAGESGEIST